MWIFRNICRVKLYQCHKSTLRTFNTNLSRSLSNTSVYKRKSLYILTSLTAFKFGKVLSLRLCIKEVVCKSFPNPVQYMHQSSLINDFFYYLLWILWCILDSLQIILRSIQLSCVFFPLLIAYPVSCVHPSVRSLWYRCLLSGIELSGPIITKLGQWASTRRDIFSEELCHNLSKLQHETRPHSWYYTRKCLEKAFGPFWHDVFVDFDNKGQPVGSGCCAQVYKAWVKKDVIESKNSFITSNQLSDERATNILGAEVLEVTGLGFLFSKYKEEHNIDRSELVPVAVKVLHPLIDIYLRQDLCILRSFATIITWLVPPVRWLSLCECVDEFAQVMTKQVNMYVEARNLKLFAYNFKNCMGIKFPCPVRSLTRSDILVETFEEGLHIQDYVKTKNEKTKKELANVGVNTILKMVFKDNFIHGDLHPGNMLVQENTNSDSVFHFPWTKTLPFHLVILDCGIVATLDNWAKNCLRDVFAAVAQDDGEEVADLFLKHSNHRCTSIPNFRRKMKEIVHNAMSKSVNLQEVDVSLLMQSLFSVMINFQVKVDSRFSSVILAIMVIEGLGRSLDPTIDIIEKAKPFLFI